MAVQPFALQRTGSPPDWSQHPDYLLLDGQQRCTAIAVGFLNPWGISGHADAEFALWVDLEAPESADVRDHVFRLLTRSHPWGYQRQNPGDRLSASGRRQAMAEFEASGLRFTGQDNLEFRPGRLPLAYAWPHDARAPVPVAVVMEAIRRLPAGCDDKVVWGEIRRDISITLRTRSIGSKNSQRRKEKAGFRDRSPYSQFVG